MPETTNTRKRLSVRVRLIPLFFRAQCLLPRTFGFQKEVRHGNDTGIMEVLAMGDEDMLIRPCVKCGLITGRFCDFCVAEERCPTEDWCGNQNGTTVQQV